MSRGVRGAHGAARRYAWPVAATVWAAAALLVVVHDVGQPVQPLVVFAFVLVAPGAAATGLVRPGDRLTRTVLAVVTSLVLATTVAQVLLATRRWSPTAWMAALGALTVAAAWTAVATRRTPRHRDRDTAPETPHTFLEAST